MSTSNLPHASYLSNNKIGVDGEIENVKMLSTNKSLHALEMNNNTNKEKTVDIV